jgi:hypothetical protein
VEGSCEHGNEPSGYIKCYEVLVSTVRTGVVALLRLEVRNLVLKNVCLGEGGESVFNDPVSS